MANKKSVLSAAAVAASMSATTVAEHSVSTADAAKAETGKVTLSARAKQLFETTEFDAGDRGKAFRKTILTTLQAEFPDTTIASAAGAYNQAKHAAVKANPTKWAALGREEGKNNGGPRKRATPVDATEQAEVGEAVTA